MDIEVFKDISYGMYVVSCKTDRPVGCFINTLVQVTAVNPTISISVNKENYTNKCIRESGKFAVSILKESDCDKIISIFGYSSSSNKDKFSDVSYEEKMGVPVVVEDMCSYVICDLVDVVDCGSHDLFIGKVINSKKINEDTPMTYKYYQEVLKGKSPKNAPTYVENKEELNNGGSLYRCSICGYIYDDSKEEIPFDDLPDNWVCPRCGVGKEQFVKLD